MHDKASPQTASAGGAGVAGGAQLSEPDGCDRELLDAMAALREDLVVRACRMTRNVDEANDLVHDALMRAMKARDKFRRGTNLRAWLLRLMANVFVDRCRQRRSHPHLVSLSNDIEPPAPELEEEVAPLSDRITPEEVRAALMQLEPGFRQVYEMRLMRKLSYDQIADELDIAVGTVGTRLLRARAQLRRILQPACARLQAPPAMEVEP